MQNATRSINAAVPCRTHVQSFSRIVELPSKCSAMVKMSTWVIILRYHGFPNFCHSHSNSSGGMGESSKMVKVVGWKWAGNGVWVWQQLMHDYICVIHPLVRNLSLSLGTPCSPNPQKASHQKSRRVWQSTTRGTGCWWQCWREGSELMMTHSNEIIPHDSAILFKWILWILMSPDNDVLYILSFPFRLGTFFLLRNM